MAKERLLGAMPSDNTPKVPNGKGKSDRDRQINVRAHGAQVEYWEAAAHEDGFTALGPWLRWLATKRAAEVFDGTSKSLED